MDSAKIGRYIKSKLKENNISQAELSQKLGISSSAVSQALTGYNSFDIENLEAIGDILDEPIDKIISAGEERMTRTEKIARLSVEEIKFEDPNLDSLKTKDRKGLSLDDYAIKHKNIELINFLEKYKIDQKHSKNLDYLSVLAEFGKFDRLKKIINYDFAPNLKKLRETPYDQLNIQEKNLVEKVIKSKNINLVNLFDKNISYYIKEPKKPQFLFNSIIFDEIYILDAFINAHENSEISRGYKRSLNETLYEVLNIAIRYNSKNCIEYIDKNTGLLSKKGNDLDTNFDMNKILNELVNSNDINIIDWFLDKYYNNSKTNKGVQLRYIEPLIKNNEIEKTQKFVKSLNQKQIDELLYRCKIHQLEMIKMLIENGAIITVPVSYSGETIQLESLTAILRELLENQNKKNY